MSIAGFLRIRSVSLRPVSRDPSICVMEGKKLIFSPALVGTGGDDQAETHVYDISAEDGDWKLEDVGIKVARSLLVMGLHLGPFSSDSFRDDWRQCPSIQAEDEKR